MFKYKKLKLLLALSCVIIFAFVVKFSAIQVLAQNVTERLELATGGLLIRNPLTSPGQDSSLYFLSGGESSIDTNQTNGTAAQIKVTTVENPGYRNASKLEFLIPKIEQSGVRPHPILGTNLTTVFKFDEYGSFSNEHGDFSWDNRPGILKFRTRSMTLSEVDDPVDIQIMRTGGTYPYQRAALTDTNANIGQFEWGAFDGTDFRSVALLFARANGIANSTSSPGSMHFATTPTGATRPVERMVITNNGNVGLGTDSPRAKMEIRGGLMTSGCTGCADLAEDYLSDQILEAGEVVSISEDGSGNVKKTNLPYDQKVIGVISSSPAIRISEDGGVVISKGDNTTSKDGYPVALTGRVPVKISTENGVIKPGDYLTSSSIPGVAMKADKKGKVVGMALEGYEQEEIGRIRVFIDITWFYP